MLDFGCGSGRVLRHFLQEAQAAEIYGCDIHAESINWGKANLCPPLHMFQSEERPPLPAPRRAARPDLDDVACSRT